MNDPDVTDNPAESRYELRVDGAVAAFVTYHHHGDRITFIHTEVDEAYEGHGLGGRLAKAVLDEARARGWKVVPRCPFIAGYIERHPEYADLTSGPGGAP
jgi:uncharacterized protein